MALTGRPFPILQLPREVRDVIYDHAALSARGYIDVSRSKSFHVSQHIPILGLVFANRQFYSECRQSLYGLNKLSFDGPEHLCAFLDMIGPDNAHLIRHLQITAPHSQADWVDIIQDPRMSSLHSVSIDGLRYTGFFTVWPNILDPRLAAAVIQALEKRGGRTRTRPGIHLRGFADSELSKFPSEWNNPLT